MKNFTREIADELARAFETDAVKAVLEETQKAADETSGTFEVVITTENLDRYNEVIKLDGWELEHYRSNPVVLWGHDHHLLPIGMATDLRIEDGKLIASGKFATHAHAQEIRQLYDLGIVKATSVGFIEKEREGNLITKAELIEFSFVSVPANPYALALAMEKELNINELVTKGFLNIKEGDNIASVDLEEDEQKDEEPAEPEPTIPEEKQAEIAAIAAATAALVLEGMSKAIALEDTEDGDPERNEDEPGDESEEEKQLREFSETRKSLQDVATALGDILAGMRREIEARN